MGIEQKSLDEKKENKKFLLMERIVLAVIAAAARFPLMYIFFGSADMKNELPITRLIFAHDGGPFVLPYPYFPLVGMFSWLSGWLTIVTNLPISFCYKLIPCFFDILLVLLVYDIAKISLSKKKTFFVGLACALAPVPLLVNGIHFQWDSIVLFLLVFSFYLRDYFVPSWLTQLCFGIFFALAFFFKPYAAMFGLFFFTPYKTFRVTLGRLWLHSMCVAAIGVVACVLFFIVFKTTRLSLFEGLWYVAPVFASLVAWIFFVLVKLRPWREWPDEFVRYLGLQAIAVVGALSCAVVVCIVLHYFGFSILGIVDFILRYANQGAPQCGLPFAVPFSLFPLSVILKNRVWLLALIGCIAHRYYRGRFDLWTSILLSFTVVLGFAGIYAPYLQWPCVFFLLAQFYRSAVIYNLLAAVYLFLFCVHPLSNGRFPYQNILSFAALRNFSWLMPSPFFTQDYFVSVLSVLGNYWIPFFCIGVTWHGFSCGAFAEVPQRKKEQFFLLRNGYIGVLTVIFCGVGLCWLAVDQANLVVRFDAAVGHKVAWYKTCEERREE
jgi:hypothetical protein